MSWNRQWSLTGLGFTGFSKFVNSVLSDLGVMSIKVTFLFMISQVEGRKLALLRYSDQPAKEIIVRNSSRPS